MNYYNYFTEIEEHFVKRRGKHLLISPMDWGLIASWRDAGIPLHVAIRGIDIAIDGFFARQDRNKAKLNSLCYCHDSVMVEYAGHLESHVGESSPEAPAENTGPEETSPQNEERGKPETLKYISERISEIKTVQEKQYNEGAGEGLARVLARLEEIRSNLETGGRSDTEALERDLVIIDDLLVVELKTTVAAEQMLEWEKEAKKDLKIYKKRLPVETYEKIRNNFLREKIHRKFRIGELSLFHL
jgi:hypothetical protein